MSEVAGGKKRKVAAVVGGALLLLVLVVVGGGALLPVDHVARRAVSLRATPDAVYGLVSDVSAQASWWPDVKKVERLPDREGLACWKQTTGMGDVTFAVVETAPAVVEAGKPRRFVTRIADENLPFGGTWTYEVEPQPSGGTRLTITERGSGASRTPCSASSRSSSSGTRRRWTRSCGRSARRWARTLRSKMFRTRLAEVPVEAR